MSDRPSSFNGEVAIHVPGLEGLNDPIVWVFPKVLVCLHCGVSQFVACETELSVLAKTQDWGRFDSIQIDSTDSSQKFNRLAIFFTKGWAYLFHNSRFAFDFGAIVEYAASRRSALRFSVGTTLIHYPTGHTDP